MRRFKCRNGVILEESTPTVMTVIRDGFQDDYNVVDWNGVEPFDTGKEEGSRDICLLLHRKGDKGFPMGGAWGEAWDIVEEVTDEGADKN